VPIQQIIDSGFNLDIKNPNTVVAENRCPDELLEELKQLQEAAALSRAALKDQLVQALER